MGTANQTKDHGLFRKLPEWPNGLSFATCQSQREMVDSGMASNIFELWKTNGEVLPFAARRDTWAPSTHVVVDRLKVTKWPYGDAYGWVYRNNVRQPPLHGLKKAPDGTPAISCAGCYQWTLVEGIDGMRKGTPSFHKRAPHVHKRGEAMGFDKFSEKPIEWVIENHPEYIKWALENVESFAVLPELLDAHTPEDPDRRIGRKFKHLNKTRMEAFLAEGEKKAC